MLRRRLLLVLLAVALGLAYADRVAFSVALDPIRHDLGLSDTDLGALGGVAFSVLYALASLPAARLADRGHHRLVITAAVAGWSLFTALTGRATSLATLFAARVGVGLGEAGAAPASLSLVADLVPSERRAGALALVWFGAYTGLVVGLGGGGLLTDRLGWRAMFVVLAAPGLPLAVLLAVLLPRPARPVPSRPEPPWPAALLAVLRQPVLRQLLLFSASGGFVAWGALLWDATFYERSFGMTATEAGLWLGLAIGAATALGTLLGGPLADRLARRGPAAPLRLAGWSLIASQPFQAASYLTASEPLSLACMVATTLVGALTVGPVQAALQNHADPRHRATATALYGLSGSLFGAALGPLFFGWLSDALAPRWGTGSLRVALVTSAVLGLWPALHLLVAARVRRDD